MISCVWTSVARVAVASIVLSPLITGLETALGSRMRLLIDEMSFKEAFSRFPNDGLNGLSPDKLKRLGQEAEILEVYDDATVTCRFDDGVQHDMPIEAFSNAGHIAAVHVRACVCVCVRACVCVCA